MSFLEDLQPASFRGVRFQVDAASNSVGRRLARFEYPGQDRPFVEDLGRRQRQFSITGFLVGDDWIDQQKRLQAALEQSGSGLLVHPVAGEVTVSVENATIDFAKSEGRMIRFTATFVEAGERRNPSQVINTAKQIDLIGDKAKASVLNQFIEQFSTKGLPEFVSNNATAQLTEMADQIDQIREGANVTSDETNELSGDIQTFKNSIDTQGVDKLGSDVLALVEGLRESVQEPDRVLELTRFGDEFLPVAETTSTRVQEAKNQSAIVSLVRRAALVEAAKSASTVSFATRDDAIAFRDETVSQFDQEILTAGDNNERDAWAALSDLKAITITDLNRRAGELSSVVQIEQNEVKPALVIAYGLYADATRGDEIAKRNKVRHSGFVPARTIEVLSA